MEALQCCRRPRTNRQKQPEASDIIVSGDVSCTNLVAVSVIPRVLTRKIYVMEDSSTLNLANSGTWTNTFAYHRLNAVDYGKTFEVFYQAVFESEAADTPSYRIEAMGYDTTNGHHQTGRSVTSLYNSDASITERTSLQGLYLWTDNGGDGNYYLKGHCNDAGTVDLIYVKLIFTELF